MRESEELEKIYFIGIGGIGMSAIARYYNHLGKKIYGYDRDNNALTKKLEAEGMIIHYEIDPTQIPEDIDLVIYTPAIDDSQAELKWCRDNDYPVIKRAEALGQLSKSKNTYAIAGTHGKTTTSSLLSHILKECNTGASALIGGIMVDYEGNFIYGDGEVLVTEADEYDRSFLQLEVEMAAIMSMDADHLDIYNSNEEVIQAFEEFTMRVRPNGKLFLKSGLIGNVTKSSILEWNSKGIEIYDFGDEDARIFTLNERVEEGKFLFDISYLGEIFSDFELCLPGKHNAENASVAFAMSIHHGLSPDDIKSAIASFGGIKRRFEKVLEKDDVVIYDDYAHHPTEIQAAISTARMLHPEKKMTVVFQPHLFSRTNDFHEAFAKELSKADEVILLEIYPAREAPMEGVTSKMIFDLIDNQDKALCKLSHLIRELNGREIEYLLIMGAGDIDKKVNQIKTIFK